MILHGDCLTLLKTLADGCVQTCVTSPPYWGLRDYGCDGQIGLEPTPDAYVQKMVTVFQEVKRVFKDDGTLWLNLGDSYAANRSYQVTPTKWKSLEFGESNAMSIPDGLKPKDLVGIPWRVAFALQADGWYLRSDIIWSKPNPMPESVTDRPTKAHEYIFLLSKRERYYYDAEAIQENNTWPDHNRFGNKNATARLVKELTGNMRPDAPEFTDREGRNKRSVWSVATQPYPDAHFATFPPKLIEPCILAGSRPGDTVLDPFAGSGTTLYVAKELNRQYIGIELNHDYIQLAERRLQQEVLSL